MTIKLELYKAYKDESNTKYVVLKKGDDVFYLWSERTNNISPYSSCGTYLGINGYDIISEWQEPVTHTVWLCLSKCGGLWISMEPVPQHEKDNHSVKAIKKITITEGEFDND